MKSGRSISYATLLDFRTAAAALAQSCITDQGAAQGGIASSPGTYPEAYILSVYSDPEFNTDRRSLC